MKTRDLIELGIPRGECVDAARAACIEAARGGMKKRVLADLAASVAAHPERYTDDANFGALARMLIEYREAHSAFAPRESNAPYRQWGRDLDEKSVAQMHAACELPVAVPISRLVVPSNAPVTEVSAIVTILLAGRPVRELLSNWSVARTTG